jgi:hypothetical protein
VEGPLGFVWRMHAEFHLQEGSAMRAGPKAEIIAPPLDLSWLPRSGASRSTHLLVNTSRSPAVRARVVRSGLDRGRTRSCAGCCPRPGRVRGRRC